MIDLITRLLGLLDRRGRIQLFLLPVPLLVVAVLEMLSVGMIVPVLQSIVAGPDGASGRLAEAIAYAADLAGMDDIVAFTCVVFVGVFFVKNLGIFTMTYLINRFTFRKLAVFTERLFALYVAMPYALHLQRNSAQMVRNLTLTASNAFQGFRLMLNLVLETSLSIAAFTILLIVEPGITVVVALAAVVLGISMYYVLSHRFRAWGREINDLEGDQIRLINQSLGAIKDVKIRHAEAYLGRLFTRVVDRLLDVRLLNVTTQEAPRLFIELIVIVGFAGIVLFFMSAEKPREDLVTLIGLFGMAAMRLMPSLNRIVASVNNLRFLDAHVETLDADTQMGIATRETPATPRLDGDRVPFEREIRLEHLTYRYEGGQETAFHDVDLVIPKGESIGIVGPSGAGKSTLVDVVLGLLTPSEGRIAVDGEDLAEQRRAWQRNFGYVPQEVYIIDDTIRRNIAFGLEDDAIDDEKVQAAVRQAHLTSVLDRMPQGLDTILGERGSRLSGGERQRVGIARALYTDPEILVFDEATSALDNQSEQEIKHAIRDLARRKTVLVIAHRLSTVRECSRIVFLKDGAVAGFGRFDDLYARVPAFRDLVNAGTETGDANATSPAVEAS